MIIITGAQLQIGRLDGAHESDVVRIAVAGGGVRVVVELPLIDYAHAAFGRLVTTAELRIHNATKTERP